VEGLAKRGLAILLELRGMFVFAAYDNSKQQLILARDRLGI
jgi:asparagine synthetase B (glutamine-hydrolysing)